MWLLLGLLPLGIVLTVAFVDIVVRRVLLLLLCVVCCCCYCESIVHSTVHIFVSHTSFVVVVVPVVIMFCGRCCFWAHLCVP